MFSLKMENTQKKKCAYVAVEEKLALDVLNIQERLITAKWGRDDAEVPGNGRVPSLWQNV